MPTRRSGKSGTTGPTGKTGRTKRAAKTAQLEKVEKVEKVEKAVSPGRALRKQNVYKGAGKRLEALVWLYEEERHGGRRLSVTELARRAHTSRQTVYRVLSSDDITPKVAGQLANALGVEGADAADEILFGGSRTRAAVERRDRVMHGQPGTAGADAAYMSARGGGSDADDGEVDGGDAGDAGEAAEPSSEDLEEFVSNMDRLVRTLRNLPGGKLGTPVRRAVLEMYADAAAEVGATLPPAYWALRKKVLAGAEL